MISPLWHLLKFCESNDFTKLKEVTTTSCMNVFDILEIATNAYMFFLAFLQWLPLEVPLDLYYSSSHHHGKDVMSYNLFQSIEISTKKKIPTWLKL